MAVVQRILAIISGRAQEIVPVTLGGAANAGMVPALDPATGLLSQTMMPPGIGPDVQTFVASEALSSGAFINIWSNAGTANARNCDGSTTGKEAHGYVLAAVASAGTATVYFSGINTGVTAQVPGDVYMSDTAVGTATATPPTTAGHTLQQIGVALSATSIQFNPGQTYARS